MAIRVKEMKRTKRLPITHPMNAPYLPWPTAFILSLLAQVCLAAPHTPNVIVILNEDQGYGDVSALHPECQFQTPNLDRLAKEGIVFTRGHSPDSVCTPARYGLLTGRYAWRTIGMTSRG